MRILYLVLTLVLTSILFGCDDIASDQLTLKGPNGCNVTQPAFTPRSNPKKKILLEEFTGHRCGYCPNGANTIKNLITTYGDQVVAIAHHSGDAIFSGFTQPFPADSGYYHYDFRCSESTTIGNYFGVAGLPTGFVNRTDFGSGVPMVYSLWPGKVSQVLSNPPLMDIQLKPFWSATDSTICVYYSVDVLENQTGHFKLGLYLTEDSIIQWQKDYSQIPNHIPDYEHNHIMRMAVNGVFGTSLTMNTELYAGEQYVDGYSTTIPVSKWNVNHLHIIAFVYNMDTDEVIQAEEIDMIP